ncbi:BrnT family toxin [Rhizobium sp. FY34]|uniref:BrnT family toxin n=1 Tax=Rhizobium sp. FY34 TaxID=2562309 RepID=UPI0010C12DDC|nr:BrnT family toxin [Rhizobium sp. FY34]
MQLDEIHGFEWDEAKRQVNLAKHGIDFLQASVALAGGRLDIHSYRHNEHRVIGVCMGTEQLIAVVFTMRNGICRIISARVARENERRAYRQIYAG